MLNLGSMRARFIAVLAASFIATAASATVQSVTPESPGTALSRHIRILASNPRDFNSLIGAGKAALELGDVQTAAGFFGRAEEVNPNAPAAKAGLGAAMAHMGDADGAIYYFDQATRLGASALTIALDRGLARDLSGDLTGAQSDYRLAIASLNSDEGRRRLALSLAIGRDRNGAMASIQPLLNRRDPAAQRTRAFVLALVGDSRGAAQAIEAVMPGGSARFAPFISSLPQLSVQEKAAAVHLGMFPDNASIRISQAQAAPAPASVPPSRDRSALAEPPATVTAPPVQTTPPVRVAVREPLPPAPKPSFSLPSQSSSAAPSFSLPSASSAAPTEDRLAQSESEQEATEPVAVAEDGESSLQQVDKSTGENKLSSIDKLLAAIEEPPPPAPSPKVESTASDDAAATKAAAAKKAADKKAADKKATEKKARDAKLAAEKKEREEAAKLGVKGTYWVQLAGGSNQDRMATEYKKLSDKAGSLLKSRPGYVTAGKEYFRLVIGPFDTKSESQAFVNKLAKEGVGGFSWTRTPSQIKIEKLSSR
ncbi:SPOR domain-containing protein [Sphingomonas sp. NSE70-1]|uniref:SPOR domain-containing protein n=1 Tax=Sphingomonas caseinilyticus TaxID=2908205 RepID=A0ABT0RWI5_9SPHN|nr:SPOR domain-containing protein [Sphingomonas caseinilyticus]MCL6699373.1 SPOR domain-containing protein [Sphingomonas caseinilyticus]